MSRRPRLRRRIREAELPPAVARTFRENLDRFVADEDGDRSARRAVAERLIGLPEGVPLAPFDALYPHAELFLSACLTVAVADGTYSVEDARMMSAYAHRLGLSARQLASLEHRVFADLRERGASRLARDKAESQEIEDAETVDAGARPDAVASSRAAGATDDTEAETADAETVESGAAASDGSPPADGTESQVSTGEAAAAPG